MFIENQKYSNFHQRKSRTFLLFTNLHLIMVSVILDDKQALEGIKEKSRGTYQKVWTSFKQMGQAERDWETHAPSEEEIITYVRFVSFSSF